MALSEALHNVGCVVEVGIHSHWYFGFGFFAENKGQSLFGGKNHLYYDRGVVKVGTSNRFPWSEMSRSLGVMYGLTLRSVLVSCFDEGMMLEVISDPKLS